MLLSATRKNHDCVREVTFGIAPYIASSIWQGRRRTLRTGGRGGHEDPTAKGGTARRDPRLGCFLAAAVAEGEGVEEECFFFTIDWLRKRRQMDTARSACAGRRRSKMPMVSPKSSDEATRATAQRMYSFQAAKAPLSVYLSLCIVVAGMDHLPTERNAFR